MELTTEAIHRLLAYIAAVEDQGYRLSEHEARTYWEATRWPRGLKGVLAGVYGAKEPTNAAELGWIRTDERGHTRITKLGRAVLGALEQADVAEEPLNLVLRADDPIAYAQVISRIAKFDEPLLVDPYFKLDHFLHVVHNTTASRLLMGPDGDVAGLSTALATSLPHDRAFVIRVSKEVHDRYIIPPSGALDMIGTSLSGVGKGKPSAIIQVEPPTVDVIRRLNEDLWNRATVLESPTSPDGAAEAEKEVSASGGSSRRRRRRSSARTINSEPFEPPRDSSNGGED
jgi:hypothetical protein